MAAVREMIIDITDPELRGSLREFGSPVKARPRTFGRGDSGPVRVRLVEPIGSDRRSFKDADTTGYAMEMAVGSLDAGPTAGTYKLVLGSNDPSGSIAYNASAATLQSSINTMTDFPGSVTVTKYGDNAYEIRWDQNGAQADLIEADENLLEPETGIYLTTMQPGSASTPTIQWLRLLQGAIAYQNTWDAYPTGAASVDTLIEGSATQKEIVRISLDEPAYDGSILITMGTVEKYSITVTQNNSADALDDLGFILFDTAGSVGVYFDGTPDASISATDRQINVNTLTTGDSKATVASKLATALAADSAFTAVANGTAVKVTLEAAGDIPEPEDVDSTFTFSNIQQGSSITSSVPVSASARDFAAALDNVVHVTKSGTYSWDLKYVDYGNQPTITVDVSALFPSGYEGDLNFVTRQCFRLFQTTTEPSVEQWMEISLTPAGEGPFTVFHSPVVVVRDIITTEQQASATLPTYYTQSELDAILALYQKHKSFYKTTSTARTATTSPAADPNLVIPVGANEVWQFEFHILVTVANSTPDWKGGLTFPSAPTGADWEYDYTDYDDQTFHPGELFNGNDTSVNVPMASTSVIRMRGVLINGANAGNISLLWSQNTSDAGATTVIRGSYAKAVKMN
jgi:hypothetical protein